MGDVKTGKGGGDEREGGICVIEDGKVGGSERLLLCEELLIF